MNPEDPLREARELAEELSLRAALDPSALSDDEARRREQDAPLRTAEAEVRAELDQWRAWLEPSEQARGDDDLIQSVLAQTTREDLSWRGELRLLGSFVRGRLRASALVRVAAASLAVHLAAWPLLAYFGVFEVREQGSFWTGFEYPELPPEEPVEEDLDLEVPSTEAELVDLEQQDIRAWARFHLDRADAQELALEPSANTPSWMALLSRRAQLWSSDADALLPAQAIEDLDLREVALRLEIHLDAWVLSGQVAPATATLSEQLLTALAEGPVATPGTWLAVAALGRACDYGQLDPAALKAWNQLVGAQGAPLGSDALSQELRRASLGRSGAPLDAAWFEALRRDGGDTLAADPVGRAWLQADPR